MLLLSAFKLQVLRGLYTVLFCGYSCSSVYFTEPGNHDNVHKLAEQGTELHSSIWMFLFRIFAPFFVLSFTLVPRSSSFLAPKPHGNACYAGWLKSIFFLVGSFFFLTLSDIFKIFILFVCTPHVNFMNNLIYCNNSMICIACEIKICSHMDYQMAFLRLTAIPAVGIAVNRK